MKHFYWIEAIKKWHSEGMGDNGCTLPYLVGIEHIINNSVLPMPSDINKIMNYAAYNKDGKIFWLRMCNNIRQPVLQITNKKSADDFNGKWIGNILIDNHFFWRGDTLDSVIDTLLSENSEKIKDQRFSYHKGDFIKYTAKDLDFIRKIKLT